MWANTDLQSSQLFQVNDISKNDYTGKHIAVSDDYLFTSKNPTVNNGQSDEDFVNRSYITVFRFNDDDTQTQVATISQPTQYTKTQHN